MARADKWRRIADRFRDIPSRFGLREYVVERWLTTTSGDLIGSGMRVVDKTPLYVGQRGEYPKVRFPSQKEIAALGPAIGECYVGPLTPDYGVGGLTRKIFDGSLVEPGQLIQVYLQGPNYPEGALFRQHQFNVDHALNMTLVLMQSEPLRAELT
jgi:hypothetical protein